MTLRGLTLGAAIGLAGAAAPPPGFSTTLTLPPVVTVRPQALNTTPPGFAPAPLPNRDAAAPTIRASKETSLSAGIFTRRDQYRGEGLAPANSVQVEQERRAKPGGGINLSMPLQ